MPQPTPYSRGYSFTGFQRQNPTTPLPGNKVDQELESIEDVLGDILTNLALIQRDDGALANASVGISQLKDEVLALIGGDATELNFYEPGGTDVALADGGTGASLSDPGADRIMFWDDSASAVAWLKIGTNLAISGDTLNASGGGAGGAGDWGSIGGTLSDQTDLQAVLDAKQDLNSLLTALAALGGYGSAGQVIKSTGSGFEWGTDNVAGGAGGDALTTNPLSQFAATTSAQLRGVISDETGTGALVFQDTPVITSNMFLRLTDSGATGGPNLIMDRSSASPATNDLLAGLAWRGRNSLGAARDYAFWQGVLLDPTSGSEDAYLNFFSYVAGTLAVRFHLYAGLTYSGGTDQGAGTINATNLFVNGANISAIYQPLDADLTALAALSSTGMLARTGTATYAQRTITGTASEITVADGSGAAGNPTLALEPDVKVKQLLYVIDGGGSTITTGVKRGLPVDFNGTITQVTLLGDQTGSIVVDIWKDTYANFPPTVAKTITASAKPTISSATKSKDSTLTGWNKTIAEGDILWFNVDSVTSLTWCIVALKVIPT